MPVLFRQFPWKKQYQWEKWSAEEINEYILKRTGSLTTLASFKDSSQSVTMYEKASVSNGEVVLSGAMTIKRSNAENEAPGKWYNPNYLYQCTTAYYNDKARCVLEGYQYEVRLQFAGYKKGGTFIETVKSTDIKSYPENGYFEGYWYVLI